MAHVKFAIYTDHFGNRTGIATCEPVRIKQARYMPRPIKVQFELPTGRALSW